jgi:putative ABC transport system permease protein
MRMEQVLQDIRHALRSWTRTPGFTAVAVITLALGIGANSAIFSVVNAVLLRPLPYEEPHQLVRLYEQGRSLGLSEDSVSLPNFSDWREQNQVFQEMGAHDFAAGNLTAGEEPRRVTYSLVSPGLFDILRVPPLLGRTFLPAEDLSGSDNVVVLSHGFWRDQFGSDPLVLGNPLILHGVNYTVVGVMPASFAFPSPEVALWRPLPREAANPLGRGHHYLDAIARLKPGVTPRQAQAEMSAIAERLAIDYPDSNEGYGVTVVPLHESAVADTRPVLLILWAAVTLVLLIACSNVSNLLLVRGASRAKELAIRAVLGAGRPRLIRQLLTETLLLCIVSGGGGLLLAAWSARWLSNLSAETLGTAGEIALDVRVVAFTAFVAVATGLLTGVVPAIRASRADLDESLKEGGRGSGAGAGHRVRNLLVVSEVAMAVVLVIGAGLLTRSFAALMTADAGFDPRNILTFRLALPEATYPTAEQTHLLYEQLVERMEALPQVESAGANILLPLQGAMENWSFYVSPGYLGTMRIPMLEGRGLARFDQRDGEHVLVIGETMARRFWPGEDPIGQRIRIRGWDTWFYGPDASETTWWKIVGIAGDVPDVALGTASNPVAYMPLAQYPAPLSAMSMAVRTRADPASAVSVVRGEVLAVDGSLPIFAVRTMEEILRDSAGKTRLSMLLIGMLAGVALGLAAVGIYGVISYSVSQRTHEIGVRMALGARPGDLLRQVVVQGLLLAGAGVGIGLLGSIALTRYLDSLLFGVAATDLATFAGVSGVLLIVALTAAFLPARRAAVVEPVAALRYE